MPHQQEEYLKFGKVKCFLVGDPINCQYKSKKEDLTTELKRIAVITKDLETENGYMCDDVEYFLDIYKDQHKYKKHEVLCRIPLKTDRFCGITTGTILNNDDKRKSATAEIYCALIFVDFTAMFLVDGEASPTSQTIQEWHKQCGLAMEHIITKPLKQIGHEYGFSDRHVLLSVTKHRVSLSCKDDHHRCMHSWLLEEVQVRQSEDRLEIHTARDTVRFDVSSGRGSHIGDILESTLRWSDGGSVGSPQSLPFKPKRHSVPNFPDLLPNSPPIREEYLMPLNQRKTDKYINCGQCDAIYGNYYHHGKSLGEGEYEVDLNDYWLELEQKHGIKCRTIVSTGKRHLVWDDSSYKDTDARSVCSEPSSVPPRLPPRPVRQISEPLQSYRRGSLPERVSRQSTLNFRSDEDPQSYNRSTLPGRASQASDSSNGSCEHEEWTRPTGHLIFRTIEKVLMRVPPTTDTLQLHHKQRVELCMKLYLTSPNSAGSGIEDWQLLSDAIGLRIEAIELITAVVRNHQLAIPAAEVVLRHWQFIFNKYGKTGPNGRCPRACTKDELIDILSDINREDLVSLVTYGH